jgi:hypothetical protein
VNGVSSREGTVFCPRSKVWSTSVSKQIGHFRRIAAGCSVNCPYCVVATGLVSGGLELARIGCLGTRCDGDQGGLPGLRANTLVISNSAFVGLGAE